jgi:methionyl-tRNA formyltransferase
MSRIAFAGSKTTTFECMERLLEDGFAIDLLVTLTPEQGSRHEVAGYMDLRPFAAARDIPVYHPHSYTLKDSEDRGALLARQVECLLVIGWQRLIPEWWLAALIRGAFGMHGSPEPLPRGRGRSPLNWSLLQGRTSFLTHLFRYDAGVDSGEIVGVQKFEINPWDDCETLHFKNRMAMNRLLARHLPAILAGHAVYTPQPCDIEPTYYPKRTAENGRIRWSDQDMARLHNHIRCQTRPFPGAFSHLEGAPGRFYFWRGTPFDSHLTFPGARPGTVVESFHDGSFVVAVWDGGVRVCDYTAPAGRRPQRGERFHDEPREGRADERS